MENYDAGKLENILRCHLTTEGSQLKLYSVRGEGHSIKKKKYILLWGTAMNVFS